MNDFRPTVRPLAGASPARARGSNSSWLFVRIVCLAVLSLLLAACDLTVVGDRNFSSLQGKLEKAVTDMKPEWKVTKPAPTNDLPRQIDLKRRPPAHRPW
jgi:hypothetical protein